MSSVTGIIVMFVFFWIYVTSPQRIAEATVVARPER